MITALECPLVISGTSLFAKKAGTLMSQYHCVFVFGKGLQFLL